MGISGIYRNRRAVIASRIIAAIALLVIGGFALFSKVDNVLAAVGSIFTGSATSISQTGVTLSGYIVTEGATSTALGFEYGTSTSYGSTVSTPRSEYLRTLIPVSGIGDGEGIQSPGVGIDSNDFVYVMDYFSGKLQKFDKNGVYQNFKIEGFSAPSGVVVDSSGNIYVADTGNDAIKKFDSSGAQLLSFGSLGSDDDHFNTPSELALDSSGNIYIIDTQNNRVKEHDASGAYIRQFGNLGDAHDLLSPFGIALDSSDNVYVADTGNARVEKFASDGTFITSFGTSGTGPGQFTSPSGIMVDSSGNIYVSDMSQNRVQKFDSSFNYISEFGSSGAGDGQFVEAYGLAMDSNGDIYVADFSGNRVQVYNPDFSNTISGLTCGTTYHYRAFATNTDGTGTGADQTFNTSPCPIVPSGGGGGSGFTYFCPDPTATNYSTRTDMIHADFALCHYPAVPPVDTLSCSAELFLTRPIKYGVYNNPDDVKLLEKFLNTYENANIAVDGFYDLNDFTLVKNWQEKYRADVLTPWHLAKPTGYVYITSLREIKKIHATNCPEKLPETNIEKICYMYKRDTNKGEKSIYVKLIQKALKAASFLNGTPDGVFGNMTFNAVKAFQKAHSLPETGNVGATTGAELEKIECKIE